MNIKKTFFSLGFLSIAFLSPAQKYTSEIAAQGIVAYNSLNFSQTNPVLGTARYSGMAGAMGALGGNASSMKDNPAGLGVYRSSDITLSPNFSISNDNSVGFNINNFGLVLNFRNSGNQRGYVTSSLGISYNRLKNFSRKSIVGGNFLDWSMSDFIGEENNFLRDDAIEVGLIDPNTFESNFNSGERVYNTTRYSESGSVGEWNFSYGMNISNRVYLGISTGFVNLNYKSVTLYDEESAINPNDWWQLDQEYEADGSGFNFKFGAIVAPTDFMRIGAALHTPTFYTIDEYYLENMNYGGFYPDPDALPWETAYDNSDLQTPLKLQGSLGFILGKTAVIGLEYQYEDFTAMRFSANGILDEGSKTVINNEMNTTHTFKAGAEVKVVDGLSLRGGFAYVTNPSTELSKEVYTSDETSFNPYPVAQPQNTYYFTGGVGYRAKSFYADLAYIHQVREESFFQYLPQYTPPHQLTLHNSNITATIGFRF